MHPRAPQLLEQGDEVLTLHRVGTVQRFVEHEHVRVGHERGGHLGALAHALAEPVDATVGGVDEADLVEHPVDRATVGDAVEIGHVLHEPARGEAARHRFVLGDERHALVHAAIAARIATVDADGSLVHVDEADHGAHERGLAGAVRSEQAGDARAERAAELAQRDLRPEPHRHLGHVDRGVGDERRIGGTVGGGGRARHRGGPVHRSVHQCSVQR